MGRIVGRKSAALSAACLNKKIAVAKPAADKQAEIPEAVFLFKAWAQNQALVLCLESKD